MPSALPRRIAVPCRSLRIAVAMVSMLALRITSVDAGDDLTTGEPFLIPAIEGGALNLVGTNSCAAGSCHGGARISEGRSFAAYQIWMRKDPHSTAYAVLSNERSSRMMALLYPKENGPAPHATKEARCLNCHVTTEKSGDLQLLPASHAVADGVGCESCHGPAKQWLGLHSTIKWKTWKKTRLLRPERGSPVNL